MFNSWKRIYPYIYIYILCNHIDLVCKVLHQTKTVQSFFNLDAKVYLQFTATIQSNPQQDRPCHFDPKLYQLPSSPLELQKHSKGRFW